MPSIGDTLREARMRQRLDIAEVEQRTKIRAKYLRALENEEFGFLPGSTFVKTFLRTYAELLGLDPHVLIEEYRANYEPGDEAEIQPLGPPAGGRERRAPPGGPPSRGVAAGALIIALLAFLLVLGLTGNEDEGGKQSARTETAQRKQPKARKHRRARPAPAPGAVTLRIVPNGPTYACIDEGEGTPPIYNGTLSEPQSFKGKRLRLNLGRTSVTMKVNGKPFPVEPGPEPVGFDFTPTASKPLPTGERPCQL
jgi:cytoskeleton protein RodZ